MTIHHLSGEAGERVLRDTAIWEDIESAISEKKCQMAPNAMAIISALHPSDDRSMLVLVDGYMTVLGHYLNVLVLQDIAEEEYADAEFMMDKIRRNKMLDSQKLLIAHGGLPLGMKKCLRPDLN